MKEENSVAILLYQKAASQIKKLHCCILRKHRSKLRAVQYVPLLEDVTLCSDSVCRIQADFKQKKN